MGSVQLGCTLLVAAGLATAGAPPHHVFVSLAAAPSRRNNANHGVGASWHRPNAGTAHATAAARPNRLPPPLVASVPPHASWAASEGQTDSLIFTSRLATFRAVYFRFIVTSRFFGNTTTVFFTANRHLDDENRSARKKWRTSMLES